jgi:hypothetical protein
MRRPFQDNLKKDHTLKGYANGKPPLEPQKSQFKIAGKEGKQKNKRFGLKISSPNQEFICTSPAALLPLPSDHPSIHLPEPEILFEN